MDWFKKWEQGNISQLPITTDFTHVSPYGRIEGKETYLKLVKDNLDKFLGHRFKIHEIIEAADKTVLRYTAIQDSFTLEVCEWHYFKDQRIQKIIAYYNIEGEISEARTLKM